MRQKNPHETKRIPLKFIAFTFGYQKGLKINNQYDYLNKLKEWGFKTNPLNKLISGIDKLLEKLVHPEWYLDWAIADLTKEGNFNVYAVFKPIVCQPACYTVKFDNPHLRMHYIQDCKYGGGMATTFSE